MPPSGAADEYGLPTHPPCPFCDGHDTELVSPFGSVLSVAAFWCRSCHSAFEVLKWGNHPASPPPDGETHHPAAQPPDRGTGRRGDGGNGGTPDG